MLSFPTLVNSSSLCFLTLFSFNLMLTLSCTGMLASSVVSKSTTPLYMRPLALHWLSALYIALCWLPALYYSTTLAPNNSILHYKGYKHDNQTGCRIATPYPGYLRWLPVLHIDLYWLPTLAPTTRGFISRTTDWK